jgi:quercetin dioxygenase-like cupin family protein
MVLVQKSAATNKVFIVNSTNVPLEEMTKQGASNAKVRYLIDERQGSERFALRLYSIEKGGHTPLDEHEYEHQVYILSGQGLLRQAKDEHTPRRTLKAGDTVFIPPNAVHQFINEKDEPLVFLCVKGNPSLYAKGSSTLGQSNKSDEPHENHC